MGHGAIARTNDCRRLNIPRDDDGSCLLLADDLNDGWDHAKAPFSRDQSGGCVCEDPTYGNDWQHYGNNRSRSDGHLSFP